MHVTLIGDSPDRNVCSKEGSEGTKISHCTGGKQELMPVIETNKTQSNDLSIFVKIWRGILMQMVTVGVCSLLHEHKLCGRFYVFNPSLVEVV